jgi:hypothetical protein
MKRFFSRQLVNIVFLVLVVAAALTIYLLSRAQPRPQSEENAAATEPLVATVSPDIETAAAPAGVPEAVFLTHLETSDVFTATAVPDAERTWTLVCAAAPSVTTRLCYTVDGGGVSSVELAFPSAAAYDSDSDSAIERYLAAAENESLSTQGDAVRALLNDLLPACDKADALSASTVRRWADDAAQVETEDDDYDAEEGGFAITIYRTRRSGEDVLICAFFLDS